MVVASLPVNLKKIVGSKFSEGLCLKGIRQKEIKDTQCPHLTPTYVHTGVHIPHTVVHRQIHPT